MATIQENPNPQPAAPANPAEPASTSAPPPKKANRIALLFRDRRVQVGLVIVIVIAAIAGWYWWQLTSGQVYTENAVVTAPVINLAPQGSGGPLQQVFVNEGDRIGANTVVAQVGNELVKSQVAGLVVSVQNNLGTIFNHGQTVVTMINPDELRLVGQIEEDNGLADVRVGQRAAFTVDAFGGKSYEGVVDEISQTARSGDVVFNISDKRQINSFNVYVRFDINRYPELKNGMSAKLWISKQ
ncbi:MAG: HlyD family efflux transporter periplasmic adaptor subunit [Patescibacteria group bacterium]|nr:HlyD family efflux transporter periplasmic adaptor subunit [Patescibacteria group bacterium]